MKSRAQSAHGICGISSKNHLAQALNMVASYQKHHRSRPAYLLVYDASQAELEQYSETCALVSVDELENEYREIRELKFKFTAFELACVLKPYFLLYAFKKFRLKSAFYVDSDIQFYSNIERLHSQLEASFVVLIPHTIKACSPPLEATDLYSERLLLLTGSYNAGFIGVRATHGGLRFLEWWKDHLSQECAVSPLKGLFHDQRWLDLVPSTFDDVAIDRSEELNVAFWNLRERQVKLKNGRYFCGSRPLAFFHFSHVNLTQPKELDPAWTMRNLKPSATINKLISEYRKSLLNLGYERCSRIPYAFDRFDNGALIPVEARRLYQRAVREKDFGDPFSVSAPDSFYHWMLKRNRNELSPLETELQRSKTPKSRLDSKIKTDLLKRSRNR